jgi:diaminopimelate epimerase
VVAGEAAKRRGRRINRPQVDPTLHPMAGTIPFTKMHGIGNDYVYVNGFEHAVSRPGKVARIISDRHTGIGGDGLILVLPPAKGVRADVRMRMFNADGSEGEMCGNGIRCVCKFAHDRGLSTRCPMRIQTGRGVLKLDYSLDRHGLVDEVTVDMGKPILALQRIPVHESRLAWKGVNHQYGVGEVGDEDDCWSAVFVSMGNPHAVFFSDENPGLMHGFMDGGFDLAKWGPRIERHRAFPHRINAHFVQVLSRREARMRTWERGSGMTMACGTGACAVAVAGALTGRLSRDVTLHLPGGDLRIHWDKRTSHVLMTGPATEVFSGQWKM